MDTYVVPPKTNREQIHNAIVNAVQKNNLYAVVHYGEAWTYFTKGERDHTSFQLLDGEMRVSDLREADKTEALFLRMESRDGDCVVYIDKILRNGENVRLGEGMIIKDEERKWFKKEGNILN